MEFSSENYLSVSAYTRRNTDESFKLKEDFCMRWNLMFWIILLYMLLTNYWICLLVVQHSEIVTGFAPENQFLVYLTSHLVLSYFITKEKRKRNRMKMYAKCLFSIQKYNFILLPTFSWTHRLSFFPTESDRKNSFLRLELNPQRALCFLMWYEM